MKRVVVTGIGMINALGLDKESSFKAICEGKTGVKEITSFDVSEFPVKIAAEITDFDPNSILDGKEVKKVDRFIQLGIKASNEAMADANFKEFDAHKFGVSSAAGIGGLPNIEKNSITYFEKGVKRISPFFIPSALVNMLGGIVSINHGLKGPNLSSVTACAASTHAISQAAKCIMIGQATNMLVIGAESTICGVGIGGFAAMKALSTRNDEPSKASRPFDANRDGFVMGEGAGAHHITSPTLEGPLSAMKQALDMAKGVKIDYVNAHGTSTPVNDKNETAALKAVFGDKCPPVSSTKGQTGHCLGGAGAIEAVISIMAMRDGIIPPTINYETPDPDCDLDYVPNKARKADIKAVMSNSFGFGGTNGVVIFKKLD